MVASDFDYIATRNEIIEGAMRIVGALEPDQNLTAEMLQQGVKALQLVVKSWSNKHLFLWSFNRSIFTTSASQESYDDTDIDETIIGLDKAWVVSDNVDVPLEVVSYSRFLEIADRSTSEIGRPMAIAYKPTPAPTVYLWPVPDAVYSVKMLAIFPLKDLELAAASGDIPARFQRALKYALAEDLFDEYPGPMNERQYVQQKAAMLFQEAKIFDKPKETTNEIASLYGYQRR